MKHLRPAAAPAKLAGDCRAIQVVRTVPERVYKALPRGDFTIFLEAVSRARSVGAAAGSTSRTSFLLVTGD